MCIQTFCEHQNLPRIFERADVYRLEVRRELFAVNAPLAVGLSV